MPIDSKEVYGLISRTDPRLTSGLTVVSTGKLYPMLSIFVFITCPILLLPILIIAPLPVTEVTVVTPGSL